jgi:hypothetical protein
MGNGCSTRASEIPLIQVQIVTFPHCFSSVKFNAQKRRKMNKGKKEETIRFLRMSSSEGN